METQLYAGASPKAVKDNLEANCYRKEVMVFEKPLSDEQLQKEQDEFVQNNIKLSRIKEEFERIKEEFKQKIKPVEKMLEDQLTVLKTKSVEVEEEVYLVDFQDEKMMGVYDNTGRLVNSRRLLPDERQMSITSQSIAM